ncbi:hypothetical protein DNTS_026915, partial [Danionella cerebrum]
VLSINPFKIVEANAEYQRKERKRWSGEGAAMFLFQLPEEVILLVLSYLDPRSLCRLSQTCRRSYQFISRDAVWRKIAKDIINTGLTRQGIDLSHSISLKDRVKVSHNWINGVCRKEILLKWKTNMLPWIELDHDVLYISQAANISAYHLRADGGKLLNSRVALFSGHQEDVCRFTLTDTHLISAGGDGKIIVHDRRSDYSVVYNGHNQEVNCIDSKGGVIVSGSRDRTAKIWALTADRFGQCLHTIPTYDRVWSVAISPSLWYVRVIYLSCGKVQSIPYKRAYSISSRTFPCRNLCKFSLN